MTRTEMRSSVAQVIPDKLRRLPLDARGYPVPFFVAWVDGKPDHRLVDPRKYNICIVTRRCWICGRRLGKFAAFVVGPMCMVNKVSAEPPSHLECAKFSLMACPHLTRPSAQRRDANLPSNVTQHPDLLTHNPGCMVLWVTDEWQLMPRIGDEPSDLVQFGEPARVTFWREGRAATRAEVLDAIALGLPHLQQMAQQEGGNALERLARRVNDAMFWLPDEAA